MTEAIRPKMHIWGPDRAQKVIFSDERAEWEARGWRDHPNKVGFPLEKPVETMTETPKRGRKAFK